MPGTITALDDWFKILKWNALPNFGNCHNIADYSAFSNHYLLTSDLDRFKKNLLSTLTGDFEQLNLKIMGRPGCGKTSFLYYLLKASENEKNKILNKYCVYIFHATRAINDDIEEIAISYIHEAWEKFYTACGHKDIHRQIMARTLVSKKKLNALTDYYKSNMSKFNKILIFVIDDTDLFPIDKVKDIVTHILRHLALSSVKKWLAIREQTYNGYDYDTKFLIDSFFTDQRIFPQISLYDIIRHRIGKCSDENPKNPFSEVLCSTVLERLHTGNLRSALSSLRNILEYSRPGGFSKSVDESVLQEYLNKNSINCFLRLNALPNLYDPTYRSCTFPVTIDILALCRHIKTESLLLGAVNTVTEVRIDKSKLIDKDKIIKIRIDDFNFSLERLEALHLVRIIDSRSSKIIELTEKGSLLNNYITRSRYREECFSLLKSKNDELFWALANVSVDHATISLDMFSWERGIR